MHSRTPHALDRYMRVSEVAARLEISDDAALRQIKSGAIPGGELVYKFEGRRGARWRVLRAHFDAWLERRAANAAIAANLAKPA